MSPHMVSPIGTAANKSKVVSAAKKSKVVRSVCGTWQTCHSVGYNFPKFLNVVLKNKTLWYYIAPLHIHTCIIFSHTQTVRIDLYNCTSIYI